MRLLRLALVLLAVAGATACGAREQKPFATPDRVASLLRAGWGVSTGSPSFDYSCMRLDARGRFFTCVARDRTHTVRVASFDVICDASRCRWSVYPAYSG